MSLLTSPVAFQAWQTPASALHADNPPPPKKKVPGVLFMGSSVGSPRGVLFFGGGLILVFFGSLGAWSGPLPRALIGSVYGPSLDSVKLPISLVSLKPPTTTELTQRYDTPAEQKSQVDVTSGVC